MEVWTGYQKSNNDKSQGTVEPQLSSPLLTNSLHYPNLSHVPHIVDNRGATIRTGYYGLSQNSCKMWTELLRKESNIPSTLCPWLRFLVFFNNIYLLYEAKALIRLILIQLIKWYIFMAAFCFHHLYQNKTVWNL